MTRGGLAGGELLFWRGGRSCHPYDRDHTEYKCQEACNRIPPGCPAQHPCPRRCWEDCGRCSVRVDVDLPCGHRQTVTCAEACGDLGAIRCGTNVVVAFPAELCGHRVAVTCAERRDWGADLRGKCPLPCGAALPCGHTCAAQCGSCSGRAHPPCTQPCGRRRQDCGHACAEPCHGTAPCPPICRERCPVACAHSKCSGVCGEPCTACAEPCAWECRHQGKCPMPCGAPCTRLPCNERCPRRLPCGHRCPSVCGEPCPDPRATHCCCECPDVVDRRVDLFEGKMLTEVDLDADPVLCLPCGHVFCRSTLDGYCELAKLYEVAAGADAAAEYDRPRPVNLADVDLLAHRPSCPDCRAPLTTVRRYGRRTKLLAIVDSEVRARKVVQLELDRVQQLLVDDAWGAVKVAAALVERTAVAPSQRLYEACAVRAQRLGATLAPGEPHAPPLYLSFPRPDVTPHARALVILAEARAIVLRSALPRAVHQLARPRLLRGRAGGSGAGDVAEVAAALCEALVTADRAYVRAYAFAHDHGCAKTAASALLGRARYQLIALEAIEALQRGHGASPVPHDDDNDATDAADAADAVARLALDDPYGDSSGGSSSDEEAEDDGGDRGTPTEQAEAHPALAQLVRESRGGVPAPTVLVRVHEACLRLAEALLQRIAAIPEHLQHVLADEIASTTRLVRNRRVTREEKLQVLRALGFGLDRGAFGGHYYCCPNGHVYVITECGGAMQRGICNECGAPIGGANHRVDPTNRVADLSEFADELH